MTKQNNTTEVCLGITPKTSTLLGCRKTRVAGMFRWAGTSNALLSHDQLRPSDIQDKYPHLSFSGGRLAMWEEMLSYGVFLAAIRG